MRLSVLSHQSGARPRNPIALPTPLPIRLVQEIISCRFPNRFLQAPVEGRGAHMMTQQPCGPGGV